MSHEIKEPVARRRRVRIYPGVLEAREKHGTTLFCAATPDQFYRAAIHLLRERRDAGWYHEPEKPPTPTFESADQLPIEVKDQAERALSYYRESLRVWESEGRWMRRMESCLELGERRLHEAGRIAWELLCERSSYQYESVEFTPLVVVGDHRDRLGWLVRNWWREVPASDAPTWWDKCSNPPTVGALFMASIELGLDVEEVEADELVSRLIESHATASARGPKPDLAPGTFVTFRGEKHVTEGEVYGLGALWAVRLAGRDRPARADHCKPLRAED